MGEHVVNDLDVSLIGCGDLYEMKSNKVLFYKQALLVLHIKEYFVPHTSYKVEDH